MKIFIDTNIFLDMLLKREYYKEAVIIFNAVEKDLYDAAILDISLLNIDYIAKKQVKNIREFLNLLNRTFTVVGAINKTVALALKIENNDLEDNLQYISAVEFKSEVIISNDKNFYQGSISVLNSREFVEKYIHE